MKFVQRFALNRSFLVGSLALGSLALAPEVASAATVVKAAKTADKKATPTAASKATAKEAAKEKEQIAPARLSVYNSSEDFDRDAAAEQRRDEAIAELTKLLPTFEEGMTKAQLLYRLGELYWEKQRYTYFLEFKQFDDAVDKWTNDGKKGPEPKVDTQKSDKFKQEALSIYDQILSKYPDYERNDEVLFNKASALYESNEKTQALDLYFQLVKRFPQSDFVPDTYLAMGEHYFHSNDLQRAITAYQKAVTSQKPRIYSFALYKLAWCDYNAQDYSGAIEKFKKVVEFSEQGSSKGKKKKKDRVQRAQTLKDMLLAYSQIDAVDEAKEYYTSKLERAELADYLGKLGLLYEDQGKWDLEIRTLKMVNTEWPTARKAPTYQAAVISAYSHLGKRDKVKEEVRRLIDLYKPGAAWAQANHDNKEALEEGFELTERALRELTTEYHAEAQKTKDEKTYTLAGDLYKEYLDAFPSSEWSYRMRFNYAEILYRNKQYEKAAEQYDLVVDADPKGKLVKESAFASVQAWEAIVEGTSPAERGKPKLDLGKIEKLDKAKSYDPEPIPDAEQKLAKACGRFVKVLPNDPDVVKVKFKEARIYFIHNQFEEAAPRFSEILEKWPNDKLGRMAAALVLESFNVKQNWVELNKYARQFRDHKELTKDASFAKEVQDFVEGSQFKIVQGIEANGQFAEAGRGYRAFVDEFPKSKFSDTALYNAMIISDKAGELDIAIPAAERLLKDYPDAKTRETTMFMVAVFYERIGEFEKSLRAYDTFVDKYPKSPKAQDAMFNSALYNDALSNNKAALAGFERYLKEYPKAKDALVVYLKIGKVYERMGDEKKLVEHYLSLEKRFADAPVATQFFAYKAVAQSFARQKKDKELTATWGAIAQKYAKLKESDKRDEAAIAVAAQARFELYEPTFKAHMALKLTLKGLQDSLVKKSKSLAEVEKEYTGLLAMGNADYGIAALTRLGQTYQDFSKTLFDAPLPPNLSDDQREIYQAELQDRAFPIEEKAIEAFEKALQKSRDLHVYNGYSALAQERLAGFKPSEYPEIRRFAVAAEEPFVNAQLVGQNSSASPAAPASAAPTAAPAEEGKASETSMAKSAPAKTSFVKKAGKAKLVLANRSSGNRTSRTGK